MACMGHGRFPMFTVILHWTFKSWAATRIKLDMFSHKTYGSIFTKTSLSYPLILPLAYEETFFRGMFLTSVLYTNPKLEKFQIWWLSKFIAFPFLIPAASMYKKRWKVGWDGKRKLKWWVLQISLLFLKDSTTMNDKMWVVRVQRPCKQKPEQCCTRGPRASPLTISLWLKPTLSSKEGMTRNKKKITQNRMQVTEDKLGLSFIS